ncbi:MAG: diguanylate cyclase, partial [Lachnospiraceae bacterium]|nr:diguanylate cyclase [Lachnospiraceae bacterium]
GDSYIRGCCSMICNIYKRSPVFRIGGDEFIVVLQNEDYACRLLRLTQMSEMFKGSYTQKDREDWERYSVSAGMAEYTADDKTVEQVQKRADAEMYANKMRFKKKFGSYR